MSEILIIAETEVLIESDVVTETLTETETEVIVEEEVVTELLETAEQGPPGPRGVPGPAGDAQTVPVGPSPLSGHTIVAADANGELIYADASNAAHRFAVLGLIDSAYSPGEDAVVQTGFIVEHLGWTWTPGPVFLGLGGAIVQTVPGSAVFCQVVGLALSATRVLVDIQPPITIA